MILKTVKVVDKRQCFKNNPQGDDTEVQYLVTFRNLGCEHVTEDLFNAVSLGQEFQLELTEVR